MPSCDEEPTEITASNSADSAGPSRESVLSGYLEWLELPAEALERLPGGVDVDPYWRLVAAFLVGYPPHSARAYFGDLKAWYGWCASSGVHPLAARRHHVDTWVRHLSQVDQPTTGRPASPASIARRLSCLSQFYDYGIRDAEVFDSSPVANVRRPKVSDDSSTVGLSADELDRLLTAAERHSARSAALVSLLVYNGLRIAEVLACDVERFTHQRGHRVLRITRKGGKASTEPLSPIVLRALEDYLGERTTGPLFLNSSGTERLSYLIAYKLIRRLARRAASQRPTRSARTACATASPPSCSPPACRCRTCRTPWATPIPAPLGPTTDPATTSIATPRTPWLRSYDAPRPQTSGIQPRGARDRRAWTDWWRARGSRSSWERDGRLQPGIHWPEISLEVRSTSQTRRRGGGRRRCSTASPHGPHRERMDLPKSS